MRTLSKILPAPEKPAHLRPSIKWLSGEGAGSWFDIQENEANNHFKISRYSPEGFVECSGTFTSEKALDLSSEYKLSYPSHCSVVTVIQEGQEIQFISVYG